MKNEIIHGESNLDFNDDLGSDYMEQNKAFCPNCCCNVDDDAKFCSSCGNKLN